MESVLEDRLWESLFTEAQQALRQSNLPKAIDDFQAALNVTLKFSEEDERRVRTLTGLAVAHSMNQQFQQAVPRFQSALELIQKVKGKNHRDCVGLLKHLAIAHTALKNFQTAEVCYDQAIAIYEQTNGNSADLQALKDRRDEIKKTLAKQNVPQQDFEADAMKMQLLSGRKTHNKLPAVNVPPPPVLPAQTAPSAATQQPSTTGNTTPPSHVSSHEPLPVLYPQGGENLEDTRNRLRGMVIDNKYEVLSEIGEGAMGTIFKGNHITLEREVAIKVMQKKLVLDASDRERFRQEAKMLSKLMHPNIVAVHDFGETTAFYYLIMDLVEGESLSNRIQERGHVDVWSTINMLVQLCDGLAHAHLKGILHRDLKPSNVMLVPQPDQADVVKLVDFGIAKSLNQSEEKLQLTQTGETVGSPLYMSPEQCRGEALDPRSDIYSLGCLAYKALTGVTPFSGRNHLEIYLKHTKDPALPFVEVTPDLVFPPKLEALIFRALEKDPDDRYESMMEFKEQLEVLAHSL